MENKIQSLEVALRNELQERDFYLEQSKKTTNPVGRDMFAMIARDEDEHYRRLQKIHEELSRKGRWPEEISAVIDKVDIMARLDAVAGLSDAAPSASRDDVDALRIAIDFETKGYNFYTRLSTEADSDPEKEFFRLMASMEWEHRLALQDTLLYFESPGDWFARKEKPHLEG